MFRVLEHIFALLGLTIFLAVLAVTLTYESVPTHNTPRTHFDTIIVLGSPADPDGKPSFEQRERVLKGVREFKAGRASHIIMTGGAAHNRWVEGEVMAKLAEANGIPAEAIVVEDQAQTTIENIFFSNRIMQQKGWTSAEVVSSPSHLPRAGWILGHYGFAWRTHAAEWPREYPKLKLAGFYVYEALGTTAWRWFGFPNAELPERK